MSLASSNDINKTENVSFSVYKIHSNGIFTQVVVNLVSIVECIDDGVILRNSHDCANVYGVQVIF